MNNTNDEQYRFLERADRLLIKGVRYSKHPFHQFTIATLTEGSAPEQRTVVLRKWDLKRQSILFHTDYRSPKVKEIQSNSNVSILFYSKQDKLQFRFSAKCHVHHNDTLAEEIYKKTTSNQRNCYEYSLVPSSICSEITKEKTLEKESRLSTVDAKDNFAVCVCNFTKMELLYLSHEGHIRVLYEWDKHGNISADYLVA